MKMSAVFDVTNEKKVKIGEIRVDVMEDSTSAVMRVVHEDDKDWKTRESRMKKDHDTYELYKVCSIEITRITTDEVHIDFRIFRRGYFTFTLMSYMLMAVIHVDPDILKDVREFHMSDTDNYCSLSETIHIKCPELDKLGYPRCLPRQDNEEKLCEMECVEYLLHRDAMHILCKEADKNVKRVRIF
jgi:hypothetical protein